MSAASKRPISSATFDDRDAITRNIVEIIAHDMDLAARNSRETPAPWNRISSRALSPLMHLRE